MSPQSGLPHNNRVGDFDVFALPVILRETGLTLDEVLDVLANKSGLEGLSGAGRDLRDIETAADAGQPAGRSSRSTSSSPRSATTSGAYLVELGGADAIVFTGGIGENSPRIRAGVCRDLDWFGIALDPAQQRRRPGRAQWSRPTARGSQVWTVPTNEEIVVARQARDLLARADGIDRLDDGALRCSSPG